MFSFVTNNYLVFLTVLTEVCNLRVDSDADPEGYHCEPSVCSDY